MREEKNSEMYVTYIWKAEYVGLHITIKYSQKTVDKNTDLPEFKSLSSRTLHINQIIYNKFSVFMKSADSPAREAARKYPIIPKLNV